MDIYEEASEWTRILREVTRRLANQLGNWTMVANAGGLTFVLTTARDSDLAKSLPLEVVYSLFLAGLLLGFVGHGLLWMSAGVSLHAWETVIRRRGRIDQWRKAETNDDVTVAVFKFDPDTRAKLKPGAKIKRNADVGGAVCYTLAIIAAVAGLSMPMFFGVL